MAPFVFPKFLVRKYILERQDESRLLLGHLGLEATLVKGLAHGSHATARAAPSDKTSAALEVEKIMLVDMLSRECLSQNVGVSGSVAEANR